MNRLLPLCLAPLLLVCSGEATGPVQPDVSTQTAIRVSITTTGVDLDPDGYLLFLDDHLLQRLLGINDTATFRDPAPGQHIVRLASVEPNCSVTDNPRQTGVIEGQTVMVSFSSTCMGVGDSTGIMTTDLSPMPGATGWTIATSLANDGSIAGSAEFGSRMRAFHRSAAGSWIDLNSIAEEQLGLSRTSMASGMSENYRVVGGTDINSPGRRATLWQERGGGWEAIHLPLGRPDGTQAGASMAEGINERGDVIVGWNSERCGGQFCGNSIGVAWIEVADGRWELEFLPASADFQVIPEAVTDTDPLQIAGDIDNERAVVWTQTGEGWRMNVLPTPPEYGATVYGMNQNGDVAGEIFPGLSDCPGAGTPAVWFRSGLSWELVEVTERNTTCAGVFPNGFAADVSDSRAVVGAFTLSGQRAFLWRGGRLQHLAPRSVAWTINESGQFAGAGLEYAHALIWTIH